ncbi:hypothetical protein [Nannocystis sp. SCPEA4]|uniref:hypothetical protein n=1 Tax=Nannocystis sp. SCPEA4 TaxID=2996787 RepID=UPI00226EF423|nr:hypothetical protein [Nannocystis sp. SCPEA4]MCY1053459.1 hypothetical protein [Nannocystis sp. SCPEA4]
MPFAPLLAALLVTQVPEPPAEGAIVWQAPPGCPDRAALERAIAGRLGRVPTAQELALVGQIGRTSAGRYHLDLRLTVAGHTQTRALTTRQCAALVDAAALLSALALDPSAAAVDPALPVELEPSPEPPLPDEPIEPDPPASQVAPPVEPTPSARPEPVDAPEPPPPAVVVDLAEPTPSPPPRRRPGGFLRLSGGFEVGALPRPTAGLDLATGVLWRRARLEFHGVYLGPQTEARGVNSVTVSLLAAGVQGCARLGRARVEFPLCGGFEMGGLRGEGRGPGARTGTGFWTAARISAGVAWHFHRLLSLNFAAQGLLRLAAARFDLSDPDAPVRLFEPSPVSLRLLLGLEVRLGDPW